MSPRCQLALLALAALAGCAGEAAPAPNIVLVVVDTLREDLGDPGGRVSLSSVERVAEEGVRFSQAFSHSPMTLPAHAALFSARPPFSTGVLTNFQGVSTELPLLADWLGRHGYGTHAVVSIGTLYPQEGRTALERGFEHFDHHDWDLETAPGVLRKLRATLDTIDPARPFFLFAHFGDPHHPYNLHSEDSAVAEVALDGELLATLTTSDMSQWQHDLELAPGQHGIEIHSEVPFKLHRLSWTQDGRELDLDWEDGDLRQAARTVRVGVRVGAGESSRLRLWISDAGGSNAEQRARYVGEVEWLDPYLEEFLAELRSRGLYDDAIVVFTSDHGEAFGEHGQAGHVHTLHDELLRVPLVLKLPSGHPARASLEAVTRSLVTHQDIVPTLLDLTGLPALPNAHGISLLQPREPLLIAQTHRPVARRDLICLRDERYKMIFAPAEDVFVMYDLEADPGEKQDVFAERYREREAWIDRLRSIATLPAAGAGSIPDRMGIEDQRRLESLGYVESLGHGEADSEPSQVRSDQSQ